MNHFNWGLTPIFPDFSERRIVSSFIAIFLVDAGGFVYHPTRIKRNRYDDQHD